MRKINEKLLQDNNLTPEQIPDLLCAPENIEVVQSKDNKTLNPLIALTIKDDLNRCSIHHKDYLQVPLKYRDKKGMLYGLQPLYCPMCNCFYIHASDVKEPFEEYLNAVGVEYKFFNLQTSAHYIISHIEPVILPIHTEIDTTTNAISEMKPICPVDNSQMEMRIYKLVYKERTYQFSAFYCEECKKIILNIVDAKNIEDSCHQNGLPTPSFVPLNDDTISVIKNVTAKIYPQCIVENGSTEEYEGSPIVLPYLTEEDTLVVNSALECEKGHDIDVTARAIQIDTRAHSLQWYVCSIGYCEECDQFIINQEDFNVLNAVGRLYAKIINNVDDDYQITCGEQFEIEKKHLNDTENIIDNGIKKIRNSTDYAGMYETGNWDDGQMIYKKDRSKRDYYPIMTKYESYKPKPYTYRVDVQLENAKSKTYYIGPQEINIDGNEQVISFNKEPGRTLVAASTIDIVLDGIQRKIALQRNLDIEHAFLYGFNDYKVANDVFEQMGITDQYLRHVLVLRRKQHNLLDIIATIQKNQDAIVHEDFKCNLLVQGCAGSGKTMVLLHRMSYLKENNPEYDFRNALIITPNERFNIQIQSVSEGLAIDEIRRKSVEQYYIDNLKLFPVEVPTIDKIEAEAAADPNVIKYVYSDKFINDFETAYDSQMIERDQINPSLEDLEHKLNITGESFTYDTDSEYETVLNNRAERIRHQISILSKSSISIKKDINDSKKDYQNNEISIEKLKEACKKSYFDLKIMTYQELERLLSLCEEKINNYPRNVQEFEDSIQKLKNDEIELEIELNKKNEELMDKHAKMEFLSAENSDVINYLKDISIKLQADNWKENIKEIVQDLSKYDDNAFDSYKTYLKRSDDLLFEAGEEYIKGKKALYSFAKEVSDESIKLNHQIIELNEKSEALSKRVIVFNRSAKIREIQQEIQKYSDQLLTNNETLSQVNLLSLDKVDTTSFDEMLMELLHMQKFCENVKPMVQSIIEEEKEYDNVFESMHTQFEDFIINIKNCLSDEIQKSNDETKNIDKQFVQMETQMENVKTDTETKILSVKESIKQLKENIDVLRKKREIWTGMHSALEQNDSEEVLFQNVMMLKDDSSKVYAAYTTYIDNTQLLKDGITKRYELSKEIEKLESVLEKMEDDSYLSGRKEESEKIDKIIENWTYKKLYNRIYASVKANCVGFDKNLYRFDLYVFLMFCLKYFGYRRNNYSFVCIDEAQDTARNEYKLFENLDSESAVYNLYGDTMQLINTEKGIQDWSQLADVFELKKYTLNENYRNTNQITQFCNEIFNMQVQQTGIDGVRVKEIHRLDLEEYVLKLKLNNDRTAIIIPRSTPKDLAVDRSKLPENIANTISKDELGKGIISLMYIDEAKGIEFDRVFVFPDGMSDNERYIAYTRALSELILVKEYM